MLTITVGGQESFDETTKKFVIVDGTELQLEHSLVSLSKWESIHEKPFLDQKDRTGEELFSYIECMLLTPNPPRDFLHRLSEKNVEEINAYINKKMTATWFTEPQTKSSSEKVTSELIYYWMTAFHIPFECENWHLNRLFTLIRICNHKQDKPKRMSRAEVAQRNRDLNAQRKRELGTKG
jgi:hypothetical protein